MMQLKVKKLAEGAVLPTYGSDLAAGADLHACTGHDVGIPAGETRMIRTGIAVEIPEGYVGLVFARSGIASRRGIAPANKVGVIDADYRGEVMVALHNHSQFDAVIEDGERIAQLVIVPYLTVDYTWSEELSDTERGAGGFGSTGK